MDNNGYYTGISKHSNYMLPPSVNYQIPFDNFNEYQTSSQLQPPNQPLPHQIQTTQQDHHDIQSTISVKLDSIDKTQSQKIDEIQVFTSNYTGNNSAASSNDFHSNLYHHYNKNLDNGDGIASYNHSSVSGYSDFDHVGGSSIGQKSLNSFLLSQQHPHQQQNQQQIQHHQQQQPNHQQQLINVLPNEISHQSKALSTFDQRLSSKCYSTSKNITTATNSQQNFPQSGYKESEMPFNYNKLPLPPIPQTYHHVYPTYDKYSLQPRVTPVHHKSYDDANVANRPYVCQTMPLGTNHKPTSQAELFCSSSATAEQHNRYTNRNYLIQNSAFIPPANGYYNTMYHRSNNVHRNLLPPPPSLQPALDDTSTYFHSNNLLMRGNSYNRSQMAYQQSHYPYGRSHHMPVPKLQSKNEIDILNGITEDLYRPYNVSYDHYDDFQYPQVPPNVTHYPTKSSKVIYAPYSANSMSTYPPTTTHQQTTSSSQQQQTQSMQQQNQHLLQQHNSVIQNQVLSSNDYNRYSCSNTQSTITYPNKVYLQDQFPYPSHSQMIYSHSANEMPQTELPKYNQIYDKRVSSSIEKLALVDLEEQITGSKILKTRDLTPSSSYECPKSNYNKDQYIYNYNAINNSYQQLRGGGDPDSAKNQSIRDYLATWNDDEEDDSETSGGKKSTQRRCLPSVDAINRNCGNKLELDGFEGASSITTPKIHVGIKVDNGGNSSNNLPDIIIDIEKPKVLGCDENYGPASDKLYVLESIDVPFSDLNKYKHLSVVNKLPDNIVQIDRRKGDSLDEVEETLKLIEKCEERVRLHKNDFELDVKFETNICASHIQQDVQNSVDYKSDVTLLTDPLSFEMPNKMPNETLNEMPLDDEQKAPTISALNSAVENDDENSSNKTVDDVREDDNDEEEEPIIDSEVVRYKCVQKKVSTNGNELIHSDVSIPKLKIKILRRKRSKSFRNRRKNQIESPDLRLTMKPVHGVGNESISNVKTLKVSCLDVINTGLFRKYLISTKNCSSENDFQYSKQELIENGIECLESEMNQSESVSELMKEIVEFSSDLIENITFNPSLEDHTNAQKHSEKVSNNSHEMNIDLCISGNIDYRCISGKIHENEPFPQFTTENLNNSLHNFEFHTPSVGEEFSDPTFEPSFESIQNINYERNDENQIAQKETNDEVRDSNQLFPLNDVECMDVLCTVDNFVDKPVTESPTNEKPVETYLEEKIDLRLSHSDLNPPSIIDNQLAAQQLNELDSIVSLGQNQPISTNQFVESEIESLNELNDLIERGNEPVTNQYAAIEPPTTSLTDSSSGSSVTTFTVKNEILPAKKMKSSDTESSSSSSLCSTSDDSSDSNFPNEDDRPQLEELSKITSVVDCLPLIDCNQIKKSQTPSTSSDEADELNSKGNEVTESEVNELKVKIEKDEESDNDNKSSSYRSSSSDDSDESSVSESDEETIIQKSPEIVVKVENSSNHDSQSIASIAKTEDTRSFCDSSEESSTESFDETEFERVINDKCMGSPKSKSISENSDDEYVDYSDDDLNENIVENTKNSNENVQSDDVDKNFSLNNPTRVHFVHKIQTDGNDLTQSKQSCKTFEAKRTPSGENNRNPSPVNSTNHLAKHLIKIEPMTEDSHVSSSSSDNSDDEYVKLSPLNFLDESSQYEKHIRKLSHRSNEKIILNRSSKDSGTESSDGYSTSASSSSFTTTSSSSDEYSCSSDDLNVCISSIVSDALKPIKLEREKVDKEEVQRKLKEYEEKSVMKAIHKQSVEESVELTQNIVPEVVKDVEAEIVQNFVQKGMLEDINVETVQTLVEEEIAKGIEVERVETSENEFVMNSLDIDVSETKNSCVDFESLLKKDNFMDERAILDEVNCNSSVSIIKFVENRVNDDLGNKISNHHINCIENELELNKHGLNEVEEKVVYCYENDEETSPVYINNEGNQEKAITTCETISHTTDNVETDVVNDHKSSKACLENSSANESPLETHILLKNGHQISTDLNYELTEAHQKKVEASDVPKPEDKDLNEGPLLSVCEHANIYCNRSIEEEKFEFQTKTFYESRQYVTDTTIISDDKKKKSNESQIVKTNFEPGGEGRSISKNSVDDTHPIDLVFPVLDIPVKLIPLPGEKFNMELYQKLIANGEIFPSRIVHDIDDFDDFSFELPVELIPLPGETIDVNAPLYLELKRKFFENRRFSSFIKLPDTDCVEESDVKKDEINTQHEFLNQYQIDKLMIPSQFDNESTLVINKTIASLKSLCERVLSSAGLHCPEDDQSATTIECDDQDVSYVYIVNEEDDFWGCTNDSSPLVVCYDDQLHDNVFIDGSINNQESENLKFDDNHCDVSNICSSLSIDSFTVDTHDIQYEEIVPANRTMYKLETFKRYMQSKYIQKPNYFQTHCIKKILKKYSNYQRYSTKRVQTKMVQNCKKKIKTLKNLINLQTKFNEKLPIILAMDCYKNKENGETPKNEVLRSNCDIKKSKMLLLTNNNVKNKKNLNSTQRSYKLNEGEISNISSYVSEMTKNNLNESRAFAKEVITKKRSIKSIPTIVTQAIRSECESQSNQINIKRKFNERTVIEPMITRNNKKRKLSFDDTLLDINRIYKQNSMIVELDKLETKSSNPSYKRRDRPMLNSHILNNSKDKVKRLIIPKSKIFDSSNVTTKAKETHSVKIQLPFVKLERNRHIDKLSRSYVAQTIKLSSNRK